MSASNVDRYGIPTNLCQVEYLNLLKSYGDISNFVPKGAVLSFHYSTTLNKVRLVVRTKNEQDGRSKQNIHCLYAIIQHSLSGFNKTYRQQFRTLGQSKLTDVVDVDAWVKLKKDSPSFIKRGGILHITNMVYYKGNIEVFAVFFNNGKSSSFSLKKAIQEVKAFKGETK